MNIPKEENLVPQIDSGRLKDIPAGFTIKVGFFLKPLHPLDNRMPKICMYIFDNQTRKTWHTGISVAEDYIKEGVTETVLRKLLESFDLALKRFKKNIGKAIINE